MKKFIYTLLCTFGLCSISYGIDRFPIIVLDNCTGKNQSSANIYQCEKNNFDTVQQALAVFYVNIQLFFPDEYQPLLLTSQNNWEKFSISECKINSYQFKDYPEKKETERLRCLNYRIKARIQHLIYIVMIWEKELGSFQIISDHPQNLSLPFTQKDN